MILDFCFFLKNVQNIDNDGAERELNEDCDVKM
jgi:hypothetical protein